jgi:hypothetical protein
MVQEHRAAPPVNRNAETIIQARETFGFYDCAQNRSEIRAQTVYCTFALGAYNVRFQRVKGQNLVAAIISCVSNERVDSCKRRGEASEQRLEDNFVKDKRQLAYIIF